MPLTRVLVTGASGFVGSHLCGILAQKGFLVRAAVRQCSSIAPGGCETVIVGEIGAKTDWSEALLNVDQVVHCAARAHVINDPPSALERYLETNCYGTERLAGAAAATGIRRFVYLSSVKVNGELTIHSPFRASDQANPTDAYARSKWLAEKRLAEIAGSAAMGVVIIRPPLVYGPGVRANFLRLMRWVDLGIPLPFGGVENRRSLVNVWNLCDLIERVLQGRVPAPATLLVSDGEDLSTPDLIRRIASAMGRQSRLLPLPVSVLRAIGRATGRRAEVARLCSSLVVDVSETRERLGWTPPVSINEGITRTVNWYANR